MRFLVTEYILSTFSPGNSGYLDLLIEGYGMVYAIVKLLRSIGQEVSITVSKHLNIAVEGAMYIDPYNYYSFLDKYLDDFDGIIAIAPPIELIKISEIVKDKLIGPPPDLVKMFSNKYTAYQILSRYGLKVPKTILIRRGFKCSKDVLDYFEFPLVVKPTMLTGSECVYIAYNLDELCFYTYKAIECDPFGEAIIQEYIGGVHGSILAIYSKSGLALYTLNLQLIGKIKNSLKYFGGILPIRDKQIAREAKAILEKLFSKHPQLKGFIGLDIIWNEEGIHIVEVNPRPTTSTLGITELYSKTGKTLIEQWTKEKHGSIFLGDIVDCYSYYIVTQTNKKPPNSKTIQLPQTTRKIIIGITKILQEAINLTKTIINTNKTVELILEL